jgi:hypothetical protein
LERRSGTRRHQRYRTHAQRLYFAACHCYYWSAPPLHTATAMSSRAASRAATVSTARFRPHHVLTIPAPELPHAAHQPHSQNTNKWWERMETKHNGLSRITTIMTTDLHTEWFTGANLMLSHT